METSNAFTHRVIELQAEFFPTNASSVGYDQYDGLVDDMSLDRDEHYATAARALIVDFEVAESSEAKPAIGPPAARAEANPPLLQLAEALQFPPPAA